MKNLDKIIDEVRNFSKI